ncbi:flavodoxin family protein [Rhodohalobacter sp. SW132]|uniref:flavodoxin family protein n=1 Tax=Rhodohalobacter sp. SW132 TaxID=2293433 RepID=UPI000E25FD09|nr:NAD(P)H-dependent oxidoreductase [Rhodohalobacter sp. SW132]REL38463.1 flavodoxin family protein [Rhodohalobacter sp. SW132]
MEHSLNSIQQKWIDENPYDFSGVSALFLNCTLKKSPEKSHTEELMQLSQQIMEAVGVKTEILRPVDNDIAAGVQPDMTEHGWEKDEWPGIQKKVMDANILIIGTPIWLGEKSSVATQVIERLYSFSGEMNDDGQYSYYGRAGGCVITGNEDGIKHCSMSILYGLQHIGYTIPPQADAGWVGEAGPGKSYADEGSGGPENEFTNRNTTFMTWNLLHIAKMLKDNGGVPAHGNQRSLWE